MANKNKTEFKLSNCKISLTDRLTDQMFSLCMNNDGADVEFVVETERIPAHRIILATRSQYFRSLLFSGLSETFERVVPLPVKLKPFKAILIYLYTGQLHFSLDNDDAANIYDVLELAHQYMIQDLMTAISDFLCPRINLGNICVNLNVATTYDLIKMLIACFKFVDENATEVVKHDSIKILTKEALIKLIKHDGLSVLEIDIFRMVLRWKSHHPGENIMPIVANMRFALMKLEELVGDVQKSGVLGPIELLKIITEKTLCANVPRRSINANSLPVSSLCEINSTQNISGSTITFKLTDMCFVNTIVIQFVKYCDHNHNNYYGYDNQYRFYVDTSSNNQNWMRIVKERTVTYSELKEEKFSFDGTQVFYIRVTCTNSKQMKISKLTAAYIKQ